MSIVLSPTTWRWSPDLSDAGVMYAGQWSNRHRHDVSTSPPPLHAAARARCPTRRRPRTLDSIPAARPTGVPRLRCSAAAAEDDCLVGDKPLLRSRAAVSASRPTRPRFASSR